MAATLPTKDAIVRYWQQHEAQLLALLGGLPDWGEPGCWVCAWDWHGEYKTWESIPLERCHIVARSLDGPNTPDNLVLMCRACHDLAPDVRDRECFGLWARGQNWFVRWASEFMRAMAHMQMPLDDDALDRYTDAVARPDFPAFIAQNTTPHWFKGNAFNSRLKPSTFAGALRLYLSQTPP